MAQFFGGDIEQQILATRIIFANSLGEVPAGGTELALRTTELLEEQIRKTRIRRSDAHGVLKAFVMNEHETSPVTGRSKPVQAQMWTFEVPVPVQSRLRPWLNPDSGAIPRLSAPNDGRPDLRADALADARRECRAWQRVADHHSACAVPTVQIPWPGWPKATEIFSPIRYPSSAAPSTQSRASRSALHRR
jgi:hypothetical protein